MAEPDRTAIVRVSDQLVRLVQILFALVIAQSLLLYKTVVLAPFNSQYWVAGAALLVVYLTTILSWMGYHRSMERNPYAMHHHRSGVSRLWDHIRLFADLFVVVLYAYLLFSIEPAVKDRDADLRNHLVGYPFVFVMYWFSGFARVRVYGRQASRGGLLAGCAAVYTVLWYIYIVLRDWHAAGYLTTASTWVLNLMAVVVFGLVMVVYRTINARMRVRAE